MTVTLRSSAAGHYALDEDINDLTPRPTLRVLHEIASNPGADSDDAVRTSGTRPDGTVGHRVITGPEQRIVLRYTGIRRSMTIATVSGDGSGYPMPIREAAGSPHRQAASLAPSYGADKPTRFGDVICDQLGCGLRQAGNRFGYAVLSDTRARLHLVAGQGQTHRRTTVRSESRCRNAHSSAWLRARRRTHRGDTTETASATTEDSRANLTGAVVPNVSGTDFSPAIVSQSAEIGNHSGAEHQLSQMLASSDAA